MRGLGGDEWNDMWRADLQTDPLWSVAFGGVTYAWIYGSPPDEPATGGPEYEVNAQLGEHITLKRVRLSSETLAPGDTLTVVLFWESDGEVRENYMVFRHVLSTSGELVAQRDGPPVYGVRPTPSWRAGEVIEDVCEIAWDDELAPGEYEISVGMYDAESMIRVPARNADGEPSLEDRIVLSVIRVEEPSAAAR
jgi:hypothetical protein